MVLEILEPITAFYTNRGKLYETQKALVSFLRAKLNMHTLHTNIATMINLKVYKEVLREVSANCDGADSS